MKRTKDKISRLEVVVQELEDSLVEKQEEIDGCNTQVTEFKDQVLNNERVIKQLNMEIQVQRKELVAELESYRKKSSNLKEEIMLRNSEYSQLETVYQSCIVKVKELELETEISKQNIQALKEENTVLKSQRNKLEDSNKELVFMNSEISELREVVETQKSRIEILEWENNQLETNLSEVQKNDEGTKVVSSKSILSEIDDKRVKAEQDANDISKRHQGLLQVHNVTVRQKERMKNHISRLTQLSQKQSAEHRVQILEAELSQALSDNQELEQKLQCFSKHRVRSESEESVEEEDKSLISTLLMDNNKLNQEIKTLHMLKLNESDKVRTAYSLLHVKEQELDQLRTKFAQAKFELDEAQLRLQNPDIFNVEDVKQDSEKKDSFFEDDEVEDINDYNEQQTTEIHEELGDQSAGSSLHSASSEGSLDNEEIQKVLQSLSGESTPSSVLETSKNESVQDYTSHSSSKNIKIDRAKIGQECNQQ